MRLYDCVCIAVNVMGWEDCEVFGVYVALHSRDYNVSENLMVENIKLEIWQCSSANWRCSVRCYLKRGAQQWTERHAEGAQLYLKPVNIFDAIYVFIKKEQHSISKITVQLCLVAAWQRLLRGETAPAVARSLRVAEVCNLNLANEAC